MAKTKEENAAVQTVETEAGGGLLDKILTDGRMARDDYQKERAKDMIGEFVSQVMSGELTMSKNMDVAINSRIAEIDRLVSAQMNEIMHHEDFQKLEGSWRGLHHLIKNSLTGPMLKIKVMSVTKKDMLKDFERREGRLYVGEGGIDVAGILAHIPHCVYSIELPNKELHEELGYAEHAARCLETLKAHLAEHPAERGAREKRRPARAATGARRPGATT